MTEREYRVVSQLFMKNFEGAAVKIVVDPYVNPDGIIRIENTLMVHPVDRHNVEVTVKLYDLIRTSPLYEELK